MPVTEFVGFKFNAPHSPNDTEVRSHLQKLASWQSAWSKYPITFYNAVDDPAVVYLVSGWEDVSAHMKWIGSEGNQILLRFFDPILYIIDFAHLGVDFSLIPSDTELLVFRKDSDSDEGDISTNSVDVHDEVALWSGQGKIIDEGERKGEVYYFRAYRNFESFKSGEHRGHQWKLMRRIHF